MFAAETGISSTGNYPGDLNLTEETQQEYWRVTYVVRPSLDDGSVSVTAVLMGDVSEGAVWRYADIRSRRSTQSRPEAQDGFGQALRVATHPQGWMISGGSGGGMRLSYEVSAPGPDPEGAGGVGIGSEAVYAPGKELFLIPDPSLTITTERDSEGRENRTSGPREVITEVIFDVPISWKIVVPWEGYGRSYRPGNPEELWDAVLAVGDFRRHSVRVAGMNVTVGIQGRQPALDSTFIEVVRRLLLAGQQIFGAPPTSRLTVLLPNVATGGESALRLGASLSLAWHSGINFPGNKDALHQLAREILHMWQNEAYTAPHWFSEGGTDYLAWLVMLRENLIDRESFRQKLMVAEQRYRDHQHSGEWTFSQEEARNAELEEAGVGTHDQGSLARTRGVIVSLTLDATIARLTGGERRLTDLMGMIYRWSSPEQGRIAVTRNADLMAVCSAVTGGDYLDEFFQSLVFSTDPPPTAAALADILSREGGN
jgi:predicted metalloprotease with PDZ domain